MFRCGKVLATARALLLVAVVGALTTAAPAGAALESCSYDPTTKIVTATITSGSQATLKVAATGELLFGLAPSGCGGATTTNTNTIQVAGSSGTLETLVLDESEGFLGPGFASESNLPEIEMAVALGDAGDRMVVIGTSGNDSIAVGASGLSYNPDGDVDATFSPLPGHMEVRGGDGVNFLTGRGGWGAGLAYNGTLTILGGPLGDELNGGNGADAITGGPGVDIVNGNAGGDDLRGEGGNDRIAGGEGDDTLLGGSGADELLAGAGNDTLLANDGEGDTQIHGAAGTDTAHVDANVDPATIAVENKIVDPGPPPPPPPPGGACTYNAATKAVSATLGVGTSATLAVVGGAIHFGVTPTACGDATTANTDVIRVIAGGGSAETLVVDQSGGALAPGATPEPTGVSEIEVEINLGDAGDDVLFVGTGGNDTLAMGARGLALNNDTDVDVTFATFPSSIELAGGGGDDTLSGRGGFGAGGVFAGPSTLRGGEGNDTLSGGNLNDLLEGEGGNDTLDGASGDDTLDGGPGNDTIGGSHGNDRLVGGTGLDRLSGAAGSDSLDAIDLEADPLIDGGAGTDSADFTRLDQDTLPFDGDYDATLTDSSALVSVEDRRPQPLPRALPDLPATPGTCTYDAARKLVAARVAPGSEATLVVVGGAIHFGTSPVACGGATTSNTDRIRIGGSTGSVERLTLDQRGGRFAPGATLETGVYAAFQEIELWLELGDTADQVVIYGTADADELTVNASGNWLLGVEMDASLTVAPVPGFVEIFFGDGADVDHFGGPLSSDGNYMGDLRVWGEGGDDLLFAGRAGGFVDGGAGADTLAGQIGPDTLIGGPGADRISGGGASDTVYANDGIADTEVRGGSNAGGGDTDTVYYDLGLDTPLEFEILHGT